MPEPRRTRTESRVASDDPARTYILINLGRMEVAGVELDDRAVEIAIQLGRHAYEEAQTQPVRTDEGLRAHALAVQAASKVYYVRCGHLIKIGTTTDLGRRFKSIRPNELLAAEPGGQELETRRHQQFATLRASGEYFHPGPALQQHIVGLREAQGAPARASSIVPDGQDWFPTGTKPSTTT